MGKNLLHKDWYHKIEPPQVISFRGGEVVIALHDLNVDVSGPAASWTGCHLW